MLEPRLPRGYSLERQSNLQMRNVDHEIVRILQFPTDTKCVDHNSSNAFINILIFCGNHEPAHDIRVGCLPNQWRNIADPKDRGDKSRWPVGHR